MILSIAGTLLVVLGLFAGGILVASPLGLVSSAPALVLWILFPLLSIVGYGLFVTGGKGAHIRGLSLAISCLLLLLAVTAAGSLVMSAASLFEPIGSTMPLWYVLVVAGVLGAVGAASYGRTGEQS